MREAWPWEEQPRSPQPQITGDISGALKLGFWASEVELQRTAALFCSGVPGEGACHLSIEISRDEAGVEGDNKVAFVVDKPTCHFRKSVVRTDESIEVHTDVYFLPESMRGSGLGRLMFRNSMIAYDELGVDYVVAVANYTNGGYTWAKLAGRCLDVPETREYLLDRLNEVAAPNGFSELDVRTLEALVKDAPEESLMYDLAQCASVEGSPLGKRFLYGSRWPVYWDLNDSAQRALIARALG